ncbi:peptidase M75 family protein [Pseudoclavibacter chungangensis]|uniref:Peptidase M75 family protein n=1 Tax=Pseudoclavibacter chungangensis TaxID=587635 RepID=A0A7J5C1V6_9MICO|nr:iron uptake system protein EfeO [Pseudoclavibacter chungangensis]KAB1662601.1 peptidase M75 family protein [Pseudoclavibacter chungangensis]NYJ68650.1 iron uptake system component EfeO [Pseudoclavibacter chungangensis]
MSMRPLAAALGGAATIAMLAGCVPNAAPDGAGTITVTSTEDTCDVSTAETTSGNITFDVTNSGSRVTEFYVLAEDGLRIVGEVENIAPGTSRQLAIVAQPGSYFTVCKPGMIGAGIGQAAFTVTGDEVAVSEDDQAAHDEAVANYKAYVRNQVGELVPAVDAFVAAYVAGDDETAKSLFASTRLFYERIEPTAESFGDLDPRIDYREVDALAEGLDWTGFHRIEKDLWPPAPGAKNSDDTDANEGWTASTPEQRKEFGDKLVADVAELQSLVNADDFTLTIDDITNGAIGLLDEVATGKVTGEEDWWSGTDLSDFQGNVEGAQVAFGIVEDLARSKGDEGVKLSDTIDQEFGALNEELAKYGNTTDGFVDYKSLTAEQVKGLSTRVDALAEPLSQLTSTVLGIPSS